MLHYALVFLLIAILAAIFGFGGIAVASAGIAEILFFVFLIAFVVSLIMHVGRRGWSQQQARGACLRLLPPALRRRCSNCCNPVKDPRGRRAATTSKRARKDAQEGTYA